MKTFSLSNDMPQLGNNQTIIENRKEEVDSIELLDFASHPSYLSEATNNTQGTSRTYWIEFY